MNKGSKTLFFVVLGFLASYSFLVADVPSTTAKDPDYPTKPIDFMITYTPGGNTDMICRALTTAARPYLNQPIVPINKPGGGGSIGTMAVMSAKPDGYTIGTAGPSALFAAPFEQAAPYKDLSGLTFIMNFTMYVQTVVVRADSPWKNWTEFIDWAKKNPGDAKIGIMGAVRTVGQGRLMLYIEQREKVKFTYVPFKGSPEMMSALLGGHIMMYVGSVDPSMVSYLEANKIRMLLYMSSYKIPSFENAPTTKELYGLLAPNVFGVCGPKGLPEYVVRRLEDAFTKAIKDPEYIRATKMMNWPEAYMNSKDMTTYVENTFRETKEIIDKLEAK
jgi:tripartite-type tricarboxylate transporter receptor subunit TctC